MVSIEIGREEGDKREGERTCVDGLLSGEQLPFVTL